jgi:hypothetical protein
MCNNLALKFHIIKQEVAKSVETGIQDTNSRVTRNGRRIENLEVASRKYNLVITGLPAGNKLDCLKS